MATITLTPEQCRTQYYVEELGNGISMDMVLIPAGTFTMGSSDDELGRSDDGREGPQHEVSVPRFFMGRYPVTQDQWQQVSAMEQIERSLTSNPSHFKGAKHPVENVSWDDAVEFCQRLAKYTNRSYRLPSEAEWEYACRAGTQTPFSCGETITTEIANYDGDDAYGEGPKGEYRSTTTPVDHFPYANAFGLSDMHGNVEEWCQDPWHENYEGAPLNGSARPEDPLHNNRRIIRGGSWYVDPRLCRSAFRFWLVSGLRNCHLGFRVVASAPRTQ